MPIGEDPGIDVRDIPLGTLRRRVSIVTQEIQLFSASVRDNLTFFNREIGDDRLREVLESLYLGAWLDGLPDRLLERLCQTVRCSSHAADSPASASAA